MTKARDRLFALCEVIRICPDYYSPSVGFRRLRTAAGERGPAIDEQT